MSSRTRQLHFRHALLLAALFLTLTFSGWALDPGPTPAAPTPVPSADNPPDNAPPAPTAATPDKPVTTAEKKTPAGMDDKPVVLPVVKPITTHPDRNAEIGRRIGEILEGNHYLRTPISPAMSQRWLKNYLDALDYNHLFFLQGDVDEFTAKYGNSLGDLLMHGRSPEAVVAPAYEIYDRYMQRLNENITLAEKLLREKYDFTKDETYSIRTNKSPWIQDAAAAATVWRGQVKSDLLNGLLDKKSPDETVKRLSKRYASILRDATEDDDTDVMERYFTALTHAYDPHSDYFSPSEAQNFNIQAIKHEVTGIGAVLRTDDGYATIEEIITGGPADLDKRLQPGDKIIAVGQGTDKPVDAVYMKLGKVVDMIRGPKGSMVRLIVVPAGTVEGSAHKILDLKRDTVSIKDRLAKGHVIEHQLPDGTTAKFGVIDLRDFYEHTAAHVAKLVEGLKKQGVSGIILDFRNNGGGLLDQAVDLTGLFVKQEPVVQIRRSDGYVDQLSTEGSRQIYDGPLVVMVNKASASATEIVAAALQDYGRAIIVGDQSTHGKGTVQTLIEMDNQMGIGFPSNPGAGKLKMTIQKFYRVAGGSTQQKGVVPDIILPSVLDALELGETTLPYYLPYDTVPTVPYDYLNLTAPYLTDLRANSAARVTASPDFGYVRQDIAFYKKRIQDSSVSLNLNTRQKEQADLKESNAARKKDLAARQGSRDKELDLTLDMIDQNLPPAPPVEKKPKVSLADDDANPNGEPDLATAVNNPKDDPQLDEAVSIMADYTRMLRDSGSKLVQTTAATPK